jgi:hypothetical protein
MDAQLPISCNETTAIREFGTSKNCMQNMAVSLAAAYVMAATVNHFVLVNMTQMAQVFHVQHTAG